MFDTIQALLDGDEFSVVERFELPGRAARFGTIPRYLFDSRIGLHLHRQLKRDGSQLWVHQTEALEALGRGENVVVSTGTASGKSLIFRSHAFHRSLLTKGRTLVFYPLKALAADQMRVGGRWLMNLSYRNLLSGVLTGPFRSRIGRRY